MRYAILGGGVAGLTVALRLGRAGHDVVVLEREHELGGLAAGFRVGDAWLEKFYHHLFGTDRAIIALIRELGLGDRLLWGTPITAMWTRGQELALNSPRAVLAYTPLPFHDRLRMGLAIAALKALPSPRPLEGQTAAHWIRRWMGTTVYERVWQPQFTAKFGPRADDLAATWFWARLHDRTTALGYLRGGFQLFYEALGAAVRCGGGEIRLGAEVTAVTGSAGSFQVETTCGPVRAERVISTLPTRVTCRLVADLPAEYRGRYGGVEAYGAHCVILAVDRPVTRSYWISVLDPGAPFMAVVEHTNWLPPDDYGGRRLIYLGNYRDMADPIYRTPREELVATAAGFLRTMNSDFDESWITEAWVFAAPFAQPIVTVDYRQHIPPFETPIPGLYLANMFQVYPHDRGQNYSVALAERLARRLLAA